MSKLGLGALTLNSALAIYTSWGDAASVAFVVAADAALLLLFLCLRYFEQAQGGDAGRGRDTKLTALLTAMFASTSRAAALMPLAVGVLVFLCLRGGEAGGGISMHEQYYALAKVGFAVLTCHTALDTYNARPDPGSAAVVFVCYTLLVILTGLFVRVFARAHAAEQEQGQR